MIFAVVAKEQLEVQQGGRLLARIAIAAVLALGIVCPSTRGFAGERSATVLEDPNLFETLHPKLRFIDDPGSTLPDDDPSIFNPNTNAGAPPLTSTTTSIDEKTFTIPGFEAAEAYQKTPYWCWAACIEMVLKFFQIAATQPQIVASFNFGVVNPFKTGSAQEIVDALNGWKFYHCGHPVAGFCTYNHGTPSDSVLLSSMMTFKRIPILGIDGHHVVIAHEARYHVDPSGAQILDSIKYFDPFDRLEKNLNWLTESSHVTDAWYVFIRLNPVFDRNTGTVDLPCSTPTSAPGLPAASGPTLYPGRPGRTF
jgi:hypothetical protein